MWLKSKMQHVPKHNEEVEEENKQREEKLDLEKKKKSHKKSKTIIISVVVLLVLFASITYALFAPGKYDDFAKCLTEKGAKMYGEDWCENTNGQKAMFGKSFKYVNYEVKPDLRIRPTWVIDGKEYERVQSFQRLSALTGCKY